MMFILCLREQALGNGNTAAFPPYLFSPPFPKTFALTESLLNTLPGYRQQKLPNKKRLDVIPFNRFCHGKKKALS